MSSAKITFVDGSTLDVLDHQNIVVQDSGVLTVNTEKSFSAFAPHSWVAIVAGKE